MPNEQSAYIGIALLIVLTYLTRCSGYILGARIQEGSRLYRIIQSLPGCALAAVISPVFVRGSWLEILAVGVTSFSFYWTGQMLLALFLGLAILIAGNHLLLV